MRHPLQPRPGRRCAGALRWAERLLAIAGIAMLGWVAAIVMDATVAQRAALQSLVETASHADGPVSPRESERTEGVPPRAPIPPLRGSALGELSIPRVKLSAVVLHGSDAQTLRRGPGHLEYTALPGESGNAVIAGHRDSFFRPLRNIQVGDDIFVGMRQGRFHYRVTSLRVVKPHDLSVLAPTDGAVLTLITCHPFWVLGDAPDRFVVRAIGVADATSVAFTAPATPRRESIGAPGARSPAGDEPFASNTRTVLDDEALVREAVERFRATYNARIISHNDVGPGGLLKFQTCEVTISAERATAACVVSAPPPDDGGSQVWALAFERAAGGWAIRSIAVQEETR